MDAHFNLAHVSWLFGSLSDKDIGLLLKNIKKNLVSNTEHIGVIVFSASISEEPAQDIRMGMGQSPKRSLAQSFALQPLIPRSRKDYIDLVES
jgi:hypothetical protein